MSSKTHTRTHPLSPCVCTRYQALVKEDARNRRELLAAEQDLRLVSRKLREAEEVVRQVGVSTEVSPCHPNLCSLGLIQVSIKTYSPVTLYISFPPPPPPTTQTAEEREEADQLLHATLKTLTGFARAVVADCISAVKQHPTTMPSTPGTSGRVAAGGTEALHAPLADLLHTSKRDAAELLRAVGISDSATGLAALQRVLAEGEVVVSDVARACRHVDCTALKAALLRVVQLRLRTEAPPHPALDSVSSIASVH
jgi:hypothetical protein